MAWDIRPTIKMRCSRFIPSSLFALIFISTVSLAAEVELAGIFGKRVVLVVNGGSPQTLSIGQRSREGVKVLEVTNPGALIEVNGERRRVMIGDAPLRIADASNAQPGPATLRLVPDTRGHYWAQGAVNGASMRFMVDTGATYVAMNAADAKRAGIDYRAGQQIVMNTANGQSLAWLVTLDRISFGGIVMHGVQASVHESGLAVALLGMSFMNRLDMRREAGDLLLSKLY